MAVTGCGAPADIVALNVTLTGANSKLAAASEPLARALASATTGSTFNAAAFESTLAQARQALTDAETICAKAPSPDAPTAKAFKEAHQNFLQGQRRLLDEIYPQIKVLASATQGDPTARKMAILEVLHSGRVLERSLLSELKATQNQMIAAFGVLTPPSLGVLGRDLADEIDFRVTELTIAAQRFGRTTSPLGSAQRADGATVKESLDRLQKAAASLTPFPSIERLKDNPAVLRLETTYGAWVKIQTATMEGPVKRIAALASDGSSPAAKIQADYQKALTDVPAGSAELTALQASLLEMTKALEATH